MTKRSLAWFNLQNTDDLRRTIKEVTQRIEKTRQRIVAANTSDDSIVEESKPKVLKHMPTPKDDDFKQWVDGVRKKRQEILEKRTARKQRRADMAKRRTAAAQERMRLINQLARKDKRDDDFGMRDEDWDVYKAINKEGGDTDSDEETEKLIELEEVLRQHDPSWQSGAEAAATPKEANQLHFGIEQLRAPELLFQPSMTGSLQAGLAETIEYVLKAYDVETSAKIAGNVYVTGGCALIPGLHKRLTKELMEIRPFKSQFKIHIQPNAVFDAWKGAREFSLRGDFAQFLISRQDYLEKGPDYLKEHAAANVFIPSPSPSSSDTCGSQVQVIQEDMETDSII